MFRLSGLAALCLFACVLASPAEAQPARARTDAFLTALRKVPGPGAAGNAQLFAEIDRFLDFAAFTDGALQPRVSRFSPAQREEFARRFRSVIRLVAYPDSGKFFRDATLRFGTVSERGDGRVDVPIQARLPKEDVQTDLILHWKGQGEAARLVDVSFDGDSLVKDYQSQFARIVDKEGPAGLLRKLAAREAELTRTDGGGAARPK